MRIIIRGRDLTDLLSYTSKNDITEFILDGVKFYLSKKCNYNDIINLFLKAIMLLSHIFIRKRFHSFIISKLYQNDEMNL